MRILKPLVKFPLAKYVLDAGVEYSYSSKMTQEILRISAARHGPGKVVVNPVALETYVKEYAGEDLTDKNIFFQRTGGAGDVINFKTVAQHIKRTWPTAKIVFCCDAGYASLFDGDPHIDELKLYPVRFDWIKACDYHMNFEALIEENEDAKRIPMADLFLNKVGFKNLPPEHKVPQLALREEAVRDVGSLLSASGFHSQDIIIGIQLIVEAPPRRYPPSELGLAAKDLAAYFGVDVLTEEEEKIEKVAEEYKQDLMSDLSKEFGKLGAKIIFLGSKHQMLELINTAAKNNISKHSVVLSQYKNLRSWQHTIAAVAHCDVILSGDSGTIHVAGAHKIPVSARTPRNSEEIQAAQTRGMFSFESTPYELHPWTPVVGIYGPFDSKNRMSYYNSAVGIDVNAICAPCDMHGYENCPKGYPSPCFRLIKESLVVSRVLELLGGSSNKNVKGLESYRNGFEVLQKAAADYVPMQFKPAPNYYEVQFKQEP